MLDKLIKKLEHVSMDVDDTDEKETIYLFARKYIVSYRDCAFTEIGISGNKVRGYTPSSSTTIKDIHEIEFFETKQILVD